MVTEYSAKTRKWHGTHLSALFAILAASGLAFNQEKCVFTISEMDFLVRHITATDVASLRANTQVILAVINLHVYTRHTVRQNYLIHHIRSLSYGPNSNVFPSLSQQLKILKL
jgi:hypothetical protein